MATADGSNDGRDEGTTSEPGHAGLSRRDALRRFGDAQVPLRHKMGTAWDVAYAALYLASDEAGFITGVCLPVDGGASARVG